MPQLTPMSTATSLCWPTQHSTKTINNVDRDIAQGLFSRKKTYMNMPESKHKNITPRMPNLPLGPYQIFTLRVKLSWLRPLDQ